MKQSKNKNRNLLPSLSEEEEKALKIFQKNWTKNSLK